MRPNTQMKFKTVSYNQLAVAYEIYIFKMCCSKWNFLMHDSWFRITKLFLKIRNLNNDKLYFEFKLSRCRASLLQFCFNIYIYKWQCQLSLVFSEEFLFSKFSRVFHTRHGWKQARSSVRPARRAQIKSTEPIVIQVFNL